MVGGIGVVLVLRSGAVIRCDFLGMMLDLPMSVVAVLENGLMALVAVALLVCGHG